MKNTQWVISRGIQESITEERIDVKTLDAFGRFAMKKGFEQSYILTLKPTETGSVIEDGNENVLETLSERIEETVWAIRDDYGTHFVATFLYPDEY